MLKIRIIIFFFIIFALLYGFKPNKNHFANHNSFLQWQNFVKHNKIKLFAPASKLSNDAIVIDYSNFSIEFFLKNNKIVYTGIQVNGVKSNNSNVIKAKQILQQFLFYINLPNSKQALKYISGYKLKYKNYSGEDAIKLIFKNKTFTVLVNNINVGYDDSKVIFDANTNVGKIYFEVSGNFSALYDSLKICGSKPINNFEENIKFKPKKIKKQDKNWKLSNLSKLEKFIFNIKDTMFSKKILNNSIQNPKNFLKSFKSGYVLNYENSLYSLNIKPVKDFFGDLYLQHQWFDDGLYFLPAKNYKINNNSITFFKDNSITANDLNALEIKICASLIERLLYEHISLGSNLYHILTEPLGAETTLVMHGKNRNVITFPSYAALTFHLNNYWFNKKVYAKALDLKKNKNHIEFKLNILVQNGVGFDFAEIRFYLNSKYQPDLIMLILHPYLNNKEK